MMIGFLLLAMMSLDGGQERHAGENCLHADQELDLFWRESHACGAIAVYGVLRRLGMPVAFEDVVSLTPIGPNGSNMGDCVRALRSNGVRAVPMSCSSQFFLEAFLETPGLSGIAHLDGGHWVFVSGVTESCVILFDYPEWKRMPNSEFEGRFTGKCVMAGDDEGIKRFNRYWQWSSVIEKAIVVLGSLNVLFLFLWRLK